MRTSVRGPGQGEEARFNDPPRSLPVGLAHHHDQERDKGHNKSRVQRDLFLKARKTEARASICGF
ncbi:hypothetical protein CPB84DRAFT_1797615 [Gymnopilus junonius]|uniref:Uncharacterized protein n=1 Tax=Gymnopilus junonius TaxID=109634 RepID=A0A9P5NAM9_GYMJU|nr:hypothetical protein CPB84DRAFT_1797615 [Gymnopilus junonius]